MMRKYFVLIVIAAFSPLAFGQENLLLNSDASGTAKHWKSYGDAEVRDFYGDSVFVVRNGGYFLQDVKLPVDSDGKYALLIGRAAAGRINGNGSITDLPNIYGYMMYDYKPAGSKINTYLQGQRMLLQSRVVDEWSTVYGVFKVASGTEAIRFFLKQASRLGDPHDGSEARFDKLGLFLFDTEEEATRFSAQY